MVLTIMEMQDEEDLLIQAEQEQVEEPTIEEHAETRAAELQKAEGCSTHAVLCCSGRAGLIASRSTWRP